MDNDGNPGNAPRWNSRGKNSMQEFLDATKKIMRYIEFDENGAPTGVFGANFSNYLGCFVRETVPCTVENWKTADEETIKDPIWKHIKVQLILVLEYKFPHETVQK